MTTERNLAATTVLGVLLVVATGVGGYELGLRGVAAFTLPLAVGMVVAVSILALATTRAE